MKRRYRSFKLMGNIGDKRFCLFFFLVRLLFHHFHIASKRFQLIQKPVVHFIFLIPIHEILTVYPLPDPDKPFRHFPALCQILLPVPALFKVQNDCKTKPDNKSSTGNPDTVFHHPHSLPVICGRLVSILL